MVSFKKTITYYFEITLHKPSNKIEHDNDLLTHFAYSPDTIKA